MAGACVNAIPTARDRRELILESFVTYYALPTVFRDLIQVFSCTMKRRLECAYGQEICSSLQVQKSFCNSISAKIRSRGNHDAMSRSAQLEDCGSHQKKNHGSIQCILRVAKTCNSSLRGRCYPGSEQTSLRSDRRHRGA